MCRRKFHRVTNEKYDNLSSLRHSQARISSFFAHCKNFSEKQNFASRDTTLKVSTIILTRAGQNSVAIFVRKPKKKALKRLKKGANFCMPPALQDGKQFFAAAMWEFLFINLR